MRASRFKPRFSFITTAAISFALISHFICFLLIYLNREWSGTELNSIRWEPETFTVLLILIPPPLLFIAAVLFSGRYRLGFLALFSLVIATSLLLVWVATYRKKLYLSCVHTARDGSDWVGHGVSATTVLGGLQIKYEPFRLRKDDSPAFFLRFNSQVRSQNAPAYPFFMYPWANQWLPVSFRDWGFQIATFQGPTTYTFSLTVPIWFLLIPCAIFPSWWLYRRFRPKIYNKLGHCRQCGYDLHGNTSEKCPECGTPVPPRKEITKTPDTSQPAA